MSAVQANGGSIRWTAAARTRTGSTARSHPCYTSQLGTRKRLSSGQTVGASLASTWHPSAGEDEPDREQEPKAPYQDLHTADDGVVGENAVGFRRR